MARKPTRKDLALAGIPDWEPSKDARQRVRIHKFNGVPDHRIAAYLGITELELRHHFHYELGEAQADILGNMAEIVLGVARQNGDVAAKLKAATLVLQTRSKHWRVPAPGAAGAADHEQDGGVQKAVGRMSESELEAEIERLRAKEAEPDEVHETDDADPE